MSTPVGSTQDPNGIVGSGGMVWDGPDIPCLGLCKRIKVTDIVYRLGMLLCEQMKKLDLSTVDVSCLVSAQTPVPTGGATLVWILARLIQLVCAHKTAIANLQKAPTGGTNTPTVDPTLDDMVPLPESLRYTDEETQLVVTELPRNQFIQFLTGKVASNVSAITAAANAADQAGELAEAADAKAEQAGQPETVTPAYVGEQDTEGNTEEIPLTAAFLLLEAGFKTLNENTGNTAEAASKQPAGLASDKRLATPTGIMSEIPGWKVEPQTGADSISNLWLAYTDLRTAFVNVMNTQLKPDAAKIIVGYTLTFSSDRQTATLSLKGQTTIPTGWVADADQPSTFTLTRGDGASYTYQILDAVSFANDGNGVVLQLASNGLNATVNTTGVLTLNLKTADGSMSAQKVATKPHPIPCVTPSVTELQTSTKNTNSFTLTWAAPSGFSAPVTQYRVALSHVGVGGTVVQDSNITTNNLQASFNELSQSTTYTAVVTAEYPCGNSEAVSISVTTMAS